MWIWTHPGKKRKFNRQRRDRESQSYHFKKEKRNSRYHFSCWIWQSLIQKSRSKECPYQRALGPVSAPHSAGSSVPQTRKVWSHRQQGWGWRLYWQRHQVGCGSGASEPISRWLAGTLHNMGSWEALKGFPSANRELHCSRCPGLNAERVSSRKSTCCLSITAPHAQQCEWHVWGNKQEQIFTFP